MIQQVQIKHDPRNPGETVFKVGPVEIPANMVQGIDITMSGRNVPQFVIHVAGNADLEILGRVTTLIHDADFLLGNMDTDKIQEESLERLTFGDGSTLASKVLEVIRERIHGIEPKGSVSGGGEADDTPGVNISSGDPL